MKLITLKIKEEELAQWDEFTKEIHSSRSDMIRNAVRVYRLFFKQQFFTNNNPAIQEQLKKIEILINGLKIEQNTLERDVLSNLDSAEIKIDKIPDQIKGQIISMLQKFNSLSIPSLSKLMEIEEPVLYRILAKMRKDKIIGFNQKYEWEVI